MRQFTPIKRRLLVLTVTLTATLAWSASALAADPLTLCVKKNGEIRAGGTCRSGEAAFQAAPKSTVDNLATRVATLETKVSTLQAKVSSLTAQNVVQQTAIDGFAALLSGVTRTAGPTLLFSGMNLQVVDGSGSTDIRNGLGNVIVGYNAGDPSAKTGSHNVVIGDEHTYTDVAGIVTGFKNSLTGRHSAVIGGESNTASGFQSFVAGGQGNTSSGLFSFASGLHGTSSAVASFVAGGVANRASGNASFAVGDNVVAGPNSCANIYNTAFGTC